MFNSAGWPRVFADVIAVLVALANGGRFELQQLPLVLHPFFCIGAEVCDVGDFDGDGMDDIIAFVRSSERGSDMGDVYGALAREIDLIALPVIVQSSLPAPVASRRP